MREEKISNENVKKQLDLFFDWYDIDIDFVFNIGEDGTNAANSMLYTGIKTGRIEIRTEDVAGGGTTIVIEQDLDHPINGERKIKYYEATAATHISSRPGKNVSEDARIFDFLSVLSKKELGDLTEMRGADIRYARLIGCLFLAV